MQPCRSARAPPLLVAALAGLLRGGAASRLLHASEAHRGTCPPGLDTLLSATRKNATGNWPQLKVVEIPVGKFVNMGLGPSFKPGFRYLVFDEDDPSGFIGTRCRIQSAVTCQGVPSGSQGPSASCYLPCQPDVHKPFLMYVRVQLGGLVAGLGAAGPRATPAAAAVVGIGAGSQPSWLLAAFPRATVDAVDIDGEVARAATECFGLPKGNPRLRVHVQDGVEFLAAHPGQYDAVLLDVAPLPGHFRTALPAVRAALKADGVLAANGWAPDEEWQRLVRDVAKSFPWAWVAGDQNNQVLIARGHSMQPARDPKELGPEALRALGAPEEALAWAAEKPWRPAAGA